jgi:glutaredoxin 3
MRNANDMPVELFASRSCPFCAEVRERLDDEGVAYVERDVDDDARARARLAELLGASAMVPVIVEDGRVIQVGVAGRGCYVRTGGRDGGR